MTPSSSFGCCFTKRISPVGQVNLLPDEDDGVLSQSSDIETYGIAGRIWEASYALTMYLTPTTILEFDPQCSICDGGCGAVVELGAGNGFLGFKMARMLSSRRKEDGGQPITLVLTDLEGVCPLLERNRGKEFPQAPDLPSVNLVIQPLEWGNLEHGWRLADLLTAQNLTARSSFPVGLLSHVVCSDLVYFPELFAPLLRSLLQLSSPPFSTATQPVQVIISYMIRSLSKETPFWNAFGAWFNFSPVLFRRRSSSSKHWERFGDLEEGTMFIFVATRKPETLAWTVPKDDELMSRGSDTFETLLFMNISYEE